MKNAVFVLCLALLAGGALANLAPMAPQAKKMGTQQAIDLSAATLGGQSQGVDCTGLPDLGDCSNFPFGTPGVTCDCDVPIPFGTCSFAGVLTLTVTKCYGVNLCGVVGDVCT